MKKRTLSIQLKIIVVWIFCLSLLGLGGFSAFLFDQKMADSILTTYAIQQNEAVDRVVRHMKEAAAQKADASKDELFGAYIQEEPSNAGAYWFLYTKDHIVFERDAMQTAMQEGKTLEQLIKEWTKKGGKQLTQVDALFQGKQHHTMFSKDESGELESVSAAIMSMNDVTYIVGSSATTSSVLQLASYPFKRILLYLGAGVIGLIICIYTITIHKQLKGKKQIQEAAEEMKRIHNTELTRMDQELRERRKQVKEYQLMDPLSLFYNREYFYTLLLNMKRQNLKSLGMIVVELGNLHRYIDRYGLEFEQDTLFRIKECLQSCIKDESVIARVRENRIVITIISDDYRLMSEECNSLEQAIKTLRLQVPVTVYSMIQMPNESAMDMYQRVDQIISIQ